MKRKEVAGVLAALILGSASLTGCGVSTSWEEEPATETSAVSEDAPSTSGFADDAASRAGGISVEPYEVIFDPELDYPQRAYPNDRHEFMVPRLGVRAPLVTSTPPQDGWNTVDHAALLGTATIVSYSGYSMVTDQKGTAVIALNARDTYDAVGNPLLDPETDEPVVQPDERFILDGVEYAFTSSVRLAVADITLDAEPFIKEDGRAVVLIYLINEDGSGSSEVVALVLHRTANQDFPAARFAG